MTGDTDMVPSLEHIFRSTTTMVEIYGWEGSVSRNYFNLQKIYPTRIFIEYMNSSHDKFTFVNVNFNSRKLRSGYHDALVFTVQRLQEGWITKLEELTRWPFQFFLI